MSNSVMRFWSVDDVKLALQVRGEALVRIQGSDADTRRAMRAAAKLAGFKVRTHKVPDSDVMFAWREDFSELEKEFRDQELAEKMRNLSFGEDDS